MKNIGTLILGIGLAIDAGRLSAADDEAIAKAAQQVEGVWKVVSVVADGKKTPDEELKDRTLTCKKGRWEFRKDGELVSHGTYQIVAAEQGVIQSNVMSENGNEPEKLIKNLNKVEGDQLTICTAQPGQERPTEFAAKEGSGHRLVVYQRVKP